MYRTRSSISYEILHGLKFPENMSTLIAYLSYFPPPPPFLPAPPARRSWTCSSHSLSCLISDDYNPSSLRQDKSVNHPNPTKRIANTSYSTTPSSSLSFSLLKFFRQHQFYLILLAIVVIFTILFLILIIYYQRSRQRQVDSNNKNKKFYYHLIPHREKKHANNKNINEENLIRLRKDQSPSQTLRIHENNQNENEETV